MYRWPRHVKLVSKPKLAVVVSPKAVDSSILRDDGRVMVSA
jgi:hypothetical protein